MKTRIKTAGLSLSVVTVIVMAANLSQSPTVLSLLIRLAILIWFVDVLIKQIVDIAGRLIIKAYDINHDKLRETVKEFNELLDVPIKRLKRNKNVDE